jgi:serine/threonine protein kinase
MSNLLLLRGHYQVVRPLGEGGLAKTYIAQDLDRPGNPLCVVKLLKPASKDSEFLPTARRLFNKEAEILEKLGRYDRIPRLLAYFEENKEFYIIQEFIEGRSLDKELSFGRRWTESKVISMLQDVLKTLEFVHSYQVIHRDIKPSNLIKRQLDGALVLIDFGAVKQVGDRGLTNDESPTKKTISIGTQGYIPTEQLKGKPRLNSDIYALGMTAIQALTGLDPLYLAEDDEGEVIWRNRAEVGEGLAEILTKMVRDRFKARYQSATEVLQDLNLLASNYPLVQEALATKQQHSEDLEEVELRKTKIAQNLELIPQPELKETKVSLGNDFTIKKTGTEAKQEAKLSSGVDPWKALSSTSGSQVKPINTNASIGIINSSSSVASELNPQETKISLNPKNSDKKVNFQDWVGDTKLSLNPKAKLHENNLELRETKVSLEAKQSIADVTPESEMRSTKVALNNVGDRESNKSQLTLPLARPNSNSVIIDRKAKINLVSLVGLLASLQNLGSIDLPIFPNQNKFRLLVGLGVVSVFASIFVGHNYLENRKSYLQAKQTLANIQELKTSKKYHECVQQAQIFPQDYSEFNVERETILKECQQSYAKEQLAQAKKLAEKSQLKDAIFLASQISRDTAASVESRLLVSKWSEKIWQIANNKYQEGKLETAIAIARSIPANSPLFQQIQNIIGQWNKDWQQNKTYIEEAQQEIKNYRWQDAINAATKVKNNQYWQKESEKIIQKAKVEIAAAQYALSQKKYQSHSTYSSTTTVRPRVNNFNSIYIDPNHPINDPNRDWVKERLGRE